MWEAEKCADPHWTPFTWALLNVFECISSTIDALVVYCRFELSRVYSRPPAKEIYPSYSRSISLSCSPIARMRIRKSRWTRKWKTCTRRCLDLDGATSRHQCTHERRHIVVELGQVVLAPVELLIEGAGLVSTFPPEGIGFFWLRQKDIMFWINKGCYLGQEHLCAGEFVVPAEFGNRLAPTLVAQYIVQVVAVSTCLV